MVRALRQHIYGKYGFLDAFNPSFTSDDVRCPTARSCRRSAGCDTDYLGIDQGPILAMIDNYRNELVWDDMRKCAPLRRGLARAGFTGGWLDQDDVMPGAGAPAGGHGRRMAIRAQSAGARWRWPPARSPAARRGRTDPRARSTSGPWAARARWSASCSPSSSANTRASRCASQQLPWTAAHEKLLTAFAGDARPTSASSATPGCPSSPPSARWSRCEPLARWRSQHLARRLLRRHLGHQPRSTARCSACRGTSTRACCSTAATCFAHAGVRRAARHLGRVARARWTRCSGSGTAAYALLLPLNEFEPLLAFALQQAIRCCATAARAATSAAPGFAARSASTSSCFATAWRRR